MFATFLGFILPIIVWILLLPLRLASKLIVISLKAGSKQVIRAYKNVSDRENNTLNSDKFKQTMKYGKVAIKTGYKLAKFGIKSTIKLVQLLIRLVSLLVDMLVAIASATSLLYSTLIVGAIVSLVAVIMVTINMEHTSATPPPSNNGGGNAPPIIRTGQDYLAIDWSQDFSTQLDRIQDSHGVEARNWVELTIIQMNTMQRSLNDNHIQFGLAGFMTGLKAVETGQTSLTSTPHLTKQEVRYSGTNNTPMQFDTAWQKYNPYYTDYPRGEKGSGYYYPDAFFGIANRFNKSAVNGFRPERTDPLYDKAFQTMGVEKTTDKLRFIRYVSNITNEYNAVFLESGNWVPGLTAEDTNNTVYVNAMLLIQFGELYGYGITDKTVELVQSLYINSKDDKFEEWYYNKSTAIKALYGMFGGGKSYPSDVDKTTNYGVIDPHGNPVQGSFFNFLVNQMPPQAQQEMWNSSGLKKFNATPSHYMRARYDLTAFLTGVYDVWWATNALGISAEVNLSSGS